MTKRDPTAREFFDRADWFNYSSLFLHMQPNQMAHIYAIPAIVLKAFSTEAYLKSLIKLEGKTAEPIHNLLKLFDQLDLESKKMIQKWWDKESKPQLAQLRKRKPPELKVPKTMREALSQSSDAFLDWRYRSKDKVVAFTILAFPQLVRRRILEIEPRWKPLPPDPLAWLNTEPISSKKHDPSLVISRFKAGSD